MKKFVSLFILVCLMLSLCACSGKAQAPEVTVIPAPEETQAAEELPAPEETAAAEESSGGFEYQGLPEEIAAAADDTLAAIKDVHPGTAGSSLRTMIAVGKLLDFSRLCEGCDPSECEHHCRLWYEANLEDEAARTEYLHCFSAVSETTRAYLANPEEYAGQIESCGYPFGDDYSEDLAEWVLNYMAIAMANYE